MNRLTFCVLSLLVASSALAATEASAPPIRPSAPVKDLVLPSFDKDGKKSSFMRAAEATFVSTTQIEVKEMQLTLFTKDGTGSFDTVLLAPSATFLTDQQIVSGQETIRLIRLDAEVSGEQWSYNHPAKRIVINKNVRVTYLEELKAIIK